ncbi:Predicted exporter [Serratia liquefaciens]|uniref:MMPL family transporter n=1 Tax=Serratia liquefaciens TaxID=614 RepID=UPI002157D19B|nr:MMPL family transporter [Serratia liquefaciens]CAI1805624.1 Predicted exporter [Serratia liquefaciens]CAI1830993.1 Predicted exporter [Serratia liquefaciens]HDS8356467.1 MMPL family transporter [Serratia liquefaciens]
MRPELHRRLAFGWLAICLLLIAALCWLLPRSQINSSVLALLPKQQLVGVPDELADGFSRRLDRQLMWLVSPPPGADNAAVDWWWQQLRQMPELQRVGGPMDAQRQQQWGRFFYQHRNVLLDDATRQRLQKGADAQSQWILGQLYSAFAGVSGKELANDPLMLVRASQLAQQQNGGLLSLSKGWLAARDVQGRSWYLLHAELSASSYDISSARLTVDKLTALQQQLQQRWPGTEVLSRGTLFYSNYASQQAEKDISTIGLASVAGVFLLVLFMFRSPLPLLLCALSVGIGALAGTVATLLAFGEIHLMTLVLSISIVGISADYTLYFLTERMVHGRQSTPLASLQKLLPALSMALLTTVVAYLALLIAPFPGLQQLAVFAAAGLSAACITVICWYPQLSRRLPVRPAPGLTLILNWLHAWRHRPLLRYGLPGAVLLLVVAGFSQLKVDDDIGQLQALPVALQQQEQRIAALTGQHNDQKWLVVYGANAEQLLQRIELLQPKLAEAKQQGVLADYRLLPLPSLQRQQENIALLQRVAPQVMNNLQQAELVLSTPDLTPEWVSPQQWLGSVVSEGWRLLWLTLPDGRSAALVPVNGVKNSAAMKTLAEQVPGTGWIDRKTEFSDLFGQYRLYLSYLLALSVAAIALIYLWRFGLRHGLRCMVPTLLSLGSGIAVLALSGHTLNLFSLLALVLVLGIGINYTLFFTNPRGTPTTSMFAIFMAVFTTQLTFGMLVLSHTQAISSFGIVLSSGIAVAFLLAPLTLVSKRKRGKA